MKGKRYVIGSNDTNSLADVDTVWGRGDDELGSMAMTAGQARKKLQYLDDGQVYELVPVDLDRAKK